MLRLASLFALLAAACSSNGVAGQVPTTNDTTVAQRATVNVGGVEREYFVQAGTGTSQTRPVIFVLHGGTRSADDVLTRSSWPALAARNNALLIVPNAIGGNWNDGRTVYMGDFDPSRVDDLGFLRRLVEIAVRDYGADRSRVYFAGASNGGYMSWRMACEAGDLVTAVAPLIATMPLDPQRTCPGARPTPVIAFFGTEDPLVPYDGSAVSFRGRETEPRSSAADSTVFWARLNGCSEEVREERLPDISPEDETTVNRVTYESCPAGLEVVRYDVMGGGHNQPGSPVPPRFAALVGKGNQDIDSVELSWAFFQRHAR
jgi:polyhydroxybutyrate depolymerase